MDHDWKGNLSNRLVEENIITGMIPTFPKIKLPEIIIYLVDLNADRWLHDYLSSSIFLVSVKSPACNL
jgi:hypothetical protein